MLFFLLVFVGFAALAWLKLKGKIVGKTPVISWQPDERCFYDPNLKKKMEFPSISSQPTLYFTVIVPAYNEESRISPMLTEAITHLEQRHAANPSIEYEIIVVDDFSKDGTISVVNRFITQYGSDKIRVLQQSQNRGKGGAIRRGVLCARGKYILFADADGASKFSDIDKLENQLKKVESKEGYGIAVGSRHSSLQPDAGTAVKKSLFRKILTWGFAFALSLLGIKGIKDTQCGFKMFTRKSASITFSLMHIERWAFDVELLLLGRSFNMPIVEVPITWNEIAGSKVDPIWDSAKMARDLLIIRFMYLFGLWSLEPPILSHFHDA